jgi:hypothetical protein
MNNGVSAMNIQAEKTNAAFQSVRAYRFRAREKCRGVLEDFRGNRKCHPTTAMDYALCKKQARIYLAALRAAAPYPLPK